jgi:hypothetical protein
LYYFVTLDTAYCKSPIDNIWYDCDDSRISICSGDIISPAAYLLFYKRRSYDISSFSEVLKRVKVEQEKEKVLRAEEEERRRRETCQPTQQSYSWGRGEALSSTNNYLQVISSAAQHGGSHETVHGTDTPPSMLPSRRQSTDTLAKPISRDELMVRNEPDDEIGATFSQNTPFLSQDNVGDAMNTQSSDAYLADLYGNEHKIPRNEDEVITRKEEDNDSLITYSGAATPIDTPFVDTPLEAATELNSQEWITAPADTTDYNANA